MDTLYSSGVELCPFRFLENHDSDSSAVFSNFIGDCKWNWTPTGIVLRFTIPKFMNRQKQCQVMIPDFEESTQFYSIQLRCVSRHA